MVLGYIDGVYNYYLWTLTFADSRTKDWPLVESPSPIIFFTLSYLVIVWIGPKMMKNMKPFKLTGPLLIYNFGLVLLNLYIFLRTLTASLKLGYNFVLCEPYIDSPDPYQLQIADAVWWFYFSKLIEFGDSFFFILRKKHEQLTFLHIYHHSTMFPLFWIGVKWVPGGTTFMPVLFNSGIHTLMYSYYGLSALGPQIVQYLWWKKYLTVLQLMQFTYGLTLGIYNIKIGCNFTTWMQYVTVFYMISFIILFGNFYINSYFKKRRLPDIDFGCGQGTLYDTKNFEVNKENWQTGKYKKNNNNSRIHRANKKST